MKISPAILLLAVPAALIAQQPQANPITTAFRNRTLALQRSIAQAFDSIPESKFTYKPTPAQLTIGYIAQHLVTDNYVFCDNFGAMKGTRSVAESQPLVLGSCVVSANQHDAERCGITGSHSGRHLDAKSLSGARCDAVTRSAHRGREHNSRSLPSAH